MLCVVAHVDATAERVTFIHVLPPSRAHDGGPHPFLDTENESVLATELHKTVASAMKAYCQVCIMNYSATYLNMVMNNGSQDVVCALHKVYFTY